MKVYCCQFDITWEQPAVNHAKVAAMLEAEKPRPGSLVLLPEMFATGFSMNVAAVTDEAAGMTSTFLKEMAKKFGIVLMGGRVTGDTSPHGRNEAVVFSAAGEELVRYRKLFPFPLAGETAHYQAGTSVETFSWGGFTVSPFICYDLRFPEAFRQAARKGAQVLTVIANWPVTREMHWRALLRARAIENQAYVVAVNRVGSDPNSVYPGRSQIIDPHGEILADAGDGEGWISAEIELEKVIEWRRRFPALEDIRGELLGG